MSTFIRNRIEVISLSDWWALSSSNEYSLEPRIKTQMEQIVESVGKSVSFGAVIKLKSCIEYTSSRETGLSLCITIAHFDLFSRTISLTFWRYVSTSWIGNHIWSWSSIASCFWPNGFFFLLLWKCIFCSESGLSDHPPSWRKKI